MSSRRASSEKRLPSMDPLIKHSSEGHYLVLTREDADIHQKEDLRRMIQLEGGRVGGSLGKHHQPHGFHAILTPQTLVQVKSHPAVSYIDVKHHEPSQEAREELNVRREQQKSISEGMESTME
jgi:hypothetical protein